MTKNAITNVQEYLTVVGEDRVYQIVNIELLLKRFRIKMAINTIRNYGKEVKAA